jgi:hypothetical protein
LKLASILGSVKSSIPSLVRQLNSEQRTNDIIYGKQRNPNKFLFIFLIGRVGTGKKIYFALHNIYYDIIIESILKLIR